MSSILQHFKDWKKVFLLVVVIVLALKDVLGITDETINKIILIALGGSGSLVAQDGVNKIKAAKKK